MKRAWVLVIVLLSAFVLAQSAGGALVASLSFTECALFDVSAARRVVKSERALECVPSRYGQAIRFRGVSGMISDKSDALRLENDPPMQFSEGFSLTLRFKLESNLSSDGERRVVEFGTQTLFAKSDDRKGLTVRLERAKDGVWYVYATNGRCCDPVLTTLAPVNLSSGRSGVRVGEWHFLALTFDPVRDEAKLYLDGLEKTRVRRQGVRSQSQRR
ncbi:MAG: LamG domain-containing protein [Pleurocapsa sp. SU_196_0]|nr:LamG domain-containing protein [Pleurocapsa sp. SU_196_0]